MLSMFLLLSLFVFILSLFLIYLLISVALMNSHNRFVNNPLVHYHPLAREEKMDDNPPLFSFFSGLSLKGDTNANNQSQLTGKMGYHGSSLLAQLHQEWLKLWGSLNSTIARIKRTEGSVTVADSIAVPLSPDLTVDCLCLTVSVYD